MKNQGAQGFPCQIFSHVGRRYQITMKVAAFGSVNKQLTAFKELDIFSGEVHSNIFEL